jgi:hypothetical protein
MAFSADNISADNFLAKNRNTRYNSRHEDNRRGGIFIIFDMCCRGEERAVFSCGAHKAGNPLKRPDSDEEIQGIPTKSKSQIQAKRARFRTKPDKSKDFQIPGHAAEASRAWRRRAALHKSYMLS